MKIRVINSKQVFKLGYFSAALMLVTLTFTPVVFAAGYTWTQPTSGYNSSSDYCYALNSSYTGQNLICANYGNYLLMSNDYGNSWNNISSAGINNWDASGMSSTGQYLIAGADGGDIYTSSDEGGTWTDQTSLGTASWGYVAVSGNGQYMFASNYSTLYVSGNYGASWSPATLNGASYIWTISASYTGQYATAVDPGGSVYITNDYGADWTAQTSLGTGSWYGDSVSPSGQYMVAVINGGGTIALSNDYGANWTSSTIPGADNLYSVAISSNGQNIIVANSDSNPAIYELFNGGQTWDADTGSGGTIWDIVTGSSDLSRVALMADDGDIFLGHNQSLYSPYTTPQQNNTPGNSDKQTGSNTPSSPDTGYGQPIGNTTSLLAIGLISLSLITAILGARLFKVTYK